MADIYRYTDYRAFLRDYFDEQKAANPAFSHQFFARKASIKSSGFVLHVMKGERNLTRPVMLNVARAIGLDSAQTAYFEDLVAFDQAKSQSDRELYFDRIAAKRGQLKLKTLDDSQYELYSAWYHSVVRELITLMPTGSDSAALAKQLIPPVTAKQVKGSLELQQDLGIIEQTDTGGYRQCDPFIAGGGPVRGTALVKYQKEMLEQAKAAWDRFAAGEMTMHTVTLCMSEELLETVRDEIRAFKTRLLELVGNEQAEPNRVYHLNLNLFPVTKPQKGRNR